MPRQKLRLLCLSKRHYMRRDLLAEQYGRMWRLPAELAESGFEVEGICAAYRQPNPPEERRLEFDSGGRIEWRSVPIGFFSPFAWSRLQRIVIETATRFKPDVLYAMSDAFQIILGARAASAAGIPFAADFYDHYEAYAATRLPGVRSALKRATRGAALVTCVSEPLRDFIHREYQFRGRVEVLENGIEPDFLEPISRTAAREALGLRPTGRLVGTAGALSRSRGIGSLQEAFLTLADEFDDLHLVLAGRLDVDLPSHPRVHFLGDLPHATMPAFYRALDVGVVCVRDDLFGRYCFPQKAAEMAAAGVPMVFPDIGVMGTDLADAWGRRVQGNSPGALAEGIRQQLRDPRAPTWRPSTWKQLSSLLGRALGGIADSEEALK